MAFRRARGGHAVISSRPRRLTEWLARDGQVASVAMSANTVVLDATLDAAEKAKLPFTVVRTIGRLFVISDQAAGAEDQVGAIGALVVTDTASALGVTAIPDPVTDGDSDVWFLFKHFSGSSSGINTGRMGWGVDFDSRAMRKVQEGEDIAFVITNQSTSFGLRYWWQVRMLIKLH